ncbi:MAG TPA: thiamine pyrophosphate-dependent enzyme [Pseudolabrys sp.]|nr:thiamine pyrophosphate-dependent enzyme [Pseudolabrys sp.]
MAERREATLDRREVAAAMMQARGDALIVTGLGSTCYDFGTQDHPNTFYLWGGMGAAAMMGLGLALAQPTRRVVVVTGDGEMLMGLGAFATIGAKAPENLSLVVFDNEQYSETGMQATHTHRGVSLTGVAAACGFPSAETVYTDHELTKAIPEIFTGRELVFRDIKVTAKRYPMSIRMRDGAHIKNRFREALLGAKAFD